MITTPAKLKARFEKMLSAIGGEANPDVNWYLNERPKTVSRDSFFRAMVWAVWVSGKSRVAADSFLERAKSKGFVWEYEIIASWDEQRLLLFLKNLHGWTGVVGYPHSRPRPVPKGAVKRWNVVYNIAKTLAKYQDEKAFQEALFGGKIKSALLDKKDIRRLINSHIAFIGEANAHYIIRNMGGEAIKCDRWVSTFLSYYHLTLEELESHLQEVGIPLGLFDTVFWAYCEKFVGETRRFAEHFDRFGQAPIARESNKMLAQLGGTEGDLNPIRRRRTAIEGY